jgi:hypothetical protein
MLPKTCGVLPRDGKTGYAVAISLALCSELGDGHRAAKTVMRWTGASERSVRGWLSGETGPSGPYLVVLARESDAVARALLKLTGRKSLEAGLQVQAARNILATTIQLLDALMT